jgi:tetratricopeptide (TPR) repeat protein
MRACYEEHLAIARELGDRRTEATALRNIGRSYRVLGNLDEAKAHAERSVSMFREMNNRLGIGRSLYHLAEVLIAEGLTGEALACLQESLAIATEVEDRMSQVRDFIAMGLLHVYAGELDSAEQALTRAEELVASSGFPNERGLLHCAMVLYQLAVKRQSLVDPELKAGTTEAVRRELGQAEARATQLGALPESELGYEIARARAAIEEFEREYGVHYGGN